MPKPKRIILIRHGQSLSNVDAMTRSRMPDHKIPLTDLGHQQAVDAGKQMKAIIGDERVAAYVSPFLRTRETAKGVLSAFEPYQIERVREDPQIREQEMGNFYDEDEMARIIRERSKHGIFFYRLPGGESGADVYSRSALFLDSLHRDFDKPYFPENVIIVSHGLTLRLLLMRWLHWSVEEFENTKNPKNCQFFEMQLNEDNHFQLCEPFIVRDENEPQPPVRSRRTMEDIYPMQKD